MKAILCHAYGRPSDLVLGEVPSPETGAHGVKIAVARAGLNFPDVLIVQGKYQAKPAFPFSPGAEVAGTVLEAGDRVTHVVPGDRVMATCGTGGFAEEVVVAGDAVFKIPDAMSFDTAAALPLTYGTTYHALVDRGGLRAGETLLVTGAGGGVGLAAVQLGAALGATVIAAAGSTAKLEAAAAAGAAHGVNYTTEKLTERVKALTGDAGVDVVYDAVGGDVFDAALRAIAWEGRLLVIGFASGRIPDIPANRLLLKGCSAIGVFWGSFAARDPVKNRHNFERLFEFYAAGTIDPKIGASYAFEDSPRAIDDLAARGIIGKAVIRVRT
jgi:NADPH2:quinone reductase